MDKDELRKHAESMVSHHEPNVPASGDIDSVIHDLRVHQIELELQNEELRDAYARLEEKGREYEELFEGAPMGLVVVDSSGMIRRCNPSFRSLLDTHETPVHTPLSQYVTDESAHLWRSRFRALFSKPDEKHIDLELHPRKSVRRILRFVGRSKGTPVKDAPEVLMMVAFEVTDEVIAREREQELLREKDLLLHELRHRTQNHLITIQSMLSFQSSYAGDPRIADALTDASRRIQAMLLVNDILTARRDQQTVSLKNYLEELVTRIGETYVAETGIAIDTDVQPLVVSADTGYTLGLIVNELLTNVFKYAFPRGRSGTVALSVRRHNGNGAVLVIEDNGIGIGIGEGAKTNSDKIAPPASEQVRSGGFGLHLVEGLVEQMRGTVTVENTGKGTRSRIEFVLDEE